MRPTDKDSGLSVDRLKELLDISPEDGSFIWLVARGSRAAFDKAGTVSDNGYITIKIDRHHYLAHRLMWLYVYGVWPEADLDHINLDKTDNRIGNLRAASKSQNVVNGRVRRDNRSGLRGVSKRDCGYVAQITVDGKKEYLGFFATAEKAHEAYRVASRLRHGEFSRF